MSTLRAENVTKTYPGVIALDNVSASFESGRIHAFIGKNGSGKSTLLKVISGAVSKDSGHILIDNDELICRSPAEAMAKGLSTVYQELSVIPGVSVAENIFMNRLPVKKTGLVNWAELYKNAESLLTKLGININPAAMLETLSVSEQQMVEIVKAMSQKPRVLALDEPTSALSKSEVQALFALLRLLKEQDVIIIYVSHRLQELWEIADTCTVLRDGKMVGKVDLPSTPRQVILDMMFGDVTIEIKPENLIPGKETVLEIVNLNKAGQFTNINLQLKKGEVLGIAGMLGSGRTELLRAIFGANQIDSGIMRVFGQQIQDISIERMCKLGIGMIQEDRRREGIIAHDTISANMILASIDDIGKSLFYDKRIEHQMVSKQINNLNIKLASPNDNMESLSGGNQQKVIVARWLNVEPKIILFDEPARGIDVAAKQQIFKIIWDLSREGISSMVVSSELEELIEVCTRIIVMQNGKLIGEVEMENLTADKLYLLCMEE